jgi:hypothetical protein
MNNLLNNDLVFICLISGIICLSTGYFIKTKIFTTVIETPQPQTFNFRLADLKKLDDMLTRGESLDTENKKLNFTPDQLREMQERLKNGDLVNREENLKLLEDLKTKFSDQMAVNPSLQQN